MNIVRTIVTCGVLASSTLWASDQIPAPAQSQVIALTGATVYPISSAPIPNGTVVLVDGKISAIGSNVTVPAGAQVVDVAGKRVYPGIINAFTSIGLTEISAVRATRDTREAGSINPNVRAEVSVNPGSEIIPVTRAAGIAVALSVPSGGTISGRSAVLMLDGWTWEDMVLEAPAALHMNWPRMTIISAWWMDDSEEKQKEDRAEALKNITTTFDDARAYMKAREADMGFPTDLRWEAMIPVLKKEIPVMVAADGIEQIQAAVAWAESEDVRLVLVGGDDAWRVTDLLKEKGVSVIVAGTHSRPSRRWEDYDLAFKIPALLKEAGVSFCISSGMGFGGSAGAAHTRSLPHNAGTAAAYGLDADEALKAITLYPAQILGIADRVGSLEVGKDATLIVTDGDPLEIMTHTERMFIQGRDIDLTSRHTMLYDKYKTKYGQSK